ncbi:MAG: winged helix-turn-helix domain-containing protein [Thiomonas sp.]
MPPHTPTSPSQLLLVEDDLRLAQQISDFLRSAGWQVTHAASAAQAEAELHPRRGDAPDFDALVLDLMLPGEDGLSLARALRRTSDVPILMLSARGEEIDRVIGLEVGADDYLPKPFSPRELLARLRALLRRAQAATAVGAAQAGVEVGKGVTRFGPFLIDAAAFRLLRDGQDVGLSVAEFTLLQVMAKHPNRVLSRDQLIDWLKGYERDAFDRSIDVRVTRLRRKIEPDPAHPVYIRTIRGQGYLFNPAGAAA